MPLQDLAALGHGVVTLFEWGRVYHDRDEKSDGRIKYLSSPVICALVPNT